MFRIVAVVLFLAGVQSAFAQKDVENQLKLAMWTNPPAEFKVTDIPEQWKNESAVVIALEREYTGDFTTKMTGLSLNRFYVEKLNIHFRIKLLDKAAVTDFSDLSFDDKMIRTNIFGKASRYRIIGIKVIKPNGTGKEVDLSAAVKTDITEERELKIPIPNLEPGDIIDYYIAYRDEKLENPDIGDELMLEGKYPMMANITRFTIPQEINFVSYPKNGAPAFKKTVNAKEKTEKYELKVTMQEKAPDLLWDYEFRTAPQIRYKLSGGFSRTPKSEATQALESFNPRLPLDIGTLEDYVKLGLKKEKDPKKLVREIYYLLRNPIYKKALFDVELGNPLNNTYTPNRFFYIMDRFLTEHKIMHEVILTTTRAYGPIEDVVSFGNVDLLIKVNTTPPIYISRPGPFTMVNEIPYILEGTDGIVKSGAAKDLPESKATDNIETTKFSLQLASDDVTKLQIKRNVVAKGHSKRPNQYSVFTNYDYLVAYNLPKYQVESSRLMGNILKEYNKEKTKFEQRKAQDYHERDEQLKQEIEGDTGGKVLDYSLTVKTIGMWDDAPDTEYDDAYTLEGLTKKAGPNIMVELGKLIGNQTAAKEDQLTRTRDVYMDYARTFVLNIELTIPEGYEVEGIENLIRNVETEAGGFVSTAVVTGNKLTVTTKKYYVKNTYKAAEWNKITGFLAAAVEFQNGKVLLRKK